MHEFNIIMECLDDTKFQDHSFEYMGNKITLIVKNTIFYNIYKKKWRIWWFSVSNFRLRSTIHYTI